MFGKMTIMTRLIVTIVISIAIGSGILSVIVMKREKMVTEIPGSIYPSDEYLSYMNDQKRVRKVYRDLFRAVEKDKLQIQNSKLQTVLCVNSYSYDNVDSVVVWAPNAKIYFVHYDPRAIEMHQERIKELGLIKVILKII